jgi:hypothetical protein
MEDIFSIIILIPGQVTRRIPEKVCDGSDRDPSVVVLVVLSIFVVPQQGRDIADLGACLVLLAQLLTRTEMLSNILTT